MEDAFMAKPAKNKKKNTKVNVKDLNTKKDPKGGPTAVEKPY